MHFASMFRHYQETLIFNGGRNVLAAGYHYCLSAPYKLFALLLTLLRTSGTLLTVPTEPASRLERQSLLDNPSLQEESGIRACPREVRTGRVDLHRQ